MQPKIWEYYCDRESRRCTPFPPASIENSNLFAYNYKNQPLSVLSTPATKLNNSMTLSQSSSLQLRGINQPDRGVTPLSTWINVEGLRLQQSRSILSLGVASNIQGRENLLSSKKVNINSIKFAAITNNPEVFPKFECEQLHLDSTARINRKMSTDRYGTQFTSNLAIIPKL